MKTGNHIIYSLLASVFMLTPGCAGDDIYEKDINTDANRVYEMHLIGGTVTVTARDLIDEYGDGEFTVANDCTIMRSFDIPLSLEWDELVVLSSPSINQLVPITKGVASFDITIPMKLTPSDDMRLDQVDLSQGMLNTFVMVPSGISSGTMTLSFPEIFNHKGQMLSYSLNISPSQRSLQISDDLNGFTIKPEQLNANAPHTNRVKMVVSIKNMASNLGGNLNVECSMIDLASDNISGYLGRRELSKTDNGFDFDFFEKYELEDKVQFADIQIMVKAHNPIGAPFKVEVDNIRFDKSGQNQWFLMNNNETAKLKPTFDLAATKGPNPLIPDTVIADTIKRDNSNIEFIGTRQPNHLTCDIKGTSNPDVTGSTQNIKNFIGTNRTLEADLKVNFPFWFSTKAYTRTDTIDFDFQDLFDEETVESFERMTFTLDFENGMPFDLTTIARVVDANDKFIANLMDQTQMLKSPTINNDGTVSGTTTSKLTIEVTKDKIQKFWDKKAMKILLDLSAMTKDAPNTMVKIQTNSTLKCKVTMNGKSQIPNL